MSLFAPPQEASPAPKDAPALARDDVTSSPFAAAVRDEHEASPDDSPTEAPADDSDSTGGVLAGLRRFFSGSGTTRPTEEREPNPNQARMESVLNRAYVTRMAIESEGAVQARAAAAEAAPLPSTPTGKPPEERRKMGPNARIDGAFDEAVRAREELRHRIDAHAAAQAAWDKTRQTLETQIEEIRRKAHDQSTLADERLTSERAAWERERGQLEARVSELRAEVRRTTELEAARTDERTAAAKATEELHAVGATIAARRELESRIESLEAAARDQAELEVTLADVRRRLREAEDERAAERTASEASQRASDERIRELQASVVAKQDVEAALRAAQAGYAAARSTWDTERRQLQTDVEARRADLRSAADEKRRLEDALDAERTERANTAEALASRVSAADVARQHAETAAAAREKDLQAAASAQAALQTTVDTLRAELGDAAEWLSAEKKGAETSRRACETLTRDLENSQRERQRLDERLVEARAEHARLGAAHRVLEIQLSDTVGRAERAEEEMNALRARLVTVSDGVERAAVPGQLRQALRAGEVGGLVEAMAPDLEKLIASIDALGRQLSSELSLSIPQRHAAEAIVARTSDARGMLHQLASFNRRQAREVREIDLNEVITRSGAALTRLCGAEVHLQVRLTPVGHVVAVEEEVEQLVASLVFNARELLTAGGSVVLATEAVHDGDTQMSLEDAVPSTTTDARLTVTANGYGVQPAVVSPALDLLARRCGGEITPQGEPGRMAGYSLDFPSM